MVVCVCVRPSAQPCACSFVSLSAQTYLRRHRFIFSQFSDAAVKNDVHVLFFEGCPFVRLSECPSVVSGQGLVPSLDQDFFLYFDPRLSDFYYQACPGR